MNAPVKADATVMCGGLRTRDIATRSARPLVSVITAVFNGAEHLAKTIESVREQQVECLTTEHIVIDGGSTDGTIDILYRYDHALEYWLSEPDHGVYDAWNKGLAVARGEWIAFLGSDDLYRPGALRAYLEHIEGSAKEFDYVSSRVEVVESSGRGRVIGEPWDWTQFSNYMNVAHVGSLHHRRLFERTGWFDPSYRITGDYELLLRAGTGLRTGFLDKITATMRGGGISASTEAIRESMRAKIESAGRNLLRAHCERLIALIKFRIRRLITA